MQMVDVLQSRLLVLRIYLKLLAGLIRIFLRPTAIMNSIVVI